MGLAEVLRHLPRLLAACAPAAHALAAERPDVFIGIDAPEFNLGLARHLKRAGIPTVQYVSPQVWAWRQGRVRTIGAAVDLVLCLLPFEREFFTRRGVRAEFVGHPLADEIPLDERPRGRPRGARIERDVPLIALLPGSRLGEVSRLARPFRRCGRRASLHAAARTYSFIAPMASAARS